jgi:hypothetical protein
VFTSQEEEAKFEKSGRRVLPDDHSGAGCLPWYLLSRGLKRPPPAFNSEGAMLSRKTFALALSSVACATANVFPSVRPKHACLYVQCCISLQICFQLRRHSC